MIDTNQANPWTRRFVPFLLSLVLIPLSLTGNGVVFPKHIVEDQHSSATLTISGAGQNDIDPSTTPGRLYVNGNGKVQWGASVVLQVSGIAPGTRVYWSYLYKPESSNQKKATVTHSFSPLPPYPFDPTDLSSTADKQGTARVIFTSTTYAGDRIHFGAGLKNPIAMEKRFRTATLKSKAFHVWKRLHLEQPRVLMNVRFPADTWDLVKTNLESLHIEIKGNLSPITLNPAHKKCQEFFTGASDDRRYGPLGPWDFGLILEYINLLFSDKKPDTVNVFILGALSKNHDLIKNIQSNATRPPQPVRYDYHYKKKELNPTEFYSYGTALAIIGQNPSVFVWSDYWWMFSQRVNVSHAKTLARVILHELGHHLLRNKCVRAKGVLDANNHIKDTITAERTIMNGCQLSVIKDGKGWDFSGISISRERWFIKNPKWHHQVERLIRQYYIPLSQ